MSFEQEIGSIIGHFYSQFNAQVYTNKVPEDFSVPSMYFPPPISVDGVFTSASFMKDFTLVVKLFHEDSQSAFAEAEKIADSIRYARRLIRIKNEDGTDSNKRLFIQRVNVRMVESNLKDVGVAQITLEWQSRYKFNEETFLKMQNVFPRYV